MYGENGALQHLKSGKSFYKVFFLATKTDGQKRQVITEGQSIKEFRLLNKYGYE